MKPVVHDPTEDGDITEGSTDRGDQTETDTDRTDGDSVPTPSQSRSPSVHPPEEDTVDVFDGYSFKGRHSVLIDDEEEASASSSSGEDTEEEEAPSGLPAEASPQLPAVDGLPTAIEVVAPEPSTPVQADVTEVEDEPKTPEARPAQLPEVAPEPTPEPTAEPAPEPVPEMPLSSEVTVPTDVIPSSVTPVEPLTPAEETAPPAEEPEVTPTVKLVPKPAAPSVDEVLPIAPLKEQPPAETVPAVPEKLVVPAVELIAATPKTPASPVTTRVTIITAPKEPTPEESRESLDQVPPMPPQKGSMSRSAMNRSGRTRREKSGIPALDKYLSADEGATDLDDDDWDFVEAGVGEEERNGAKATSLFARGVVDRYKLAVFRKGGQTPQRNGGRSFSGMSNASDVTSLASPTGPDSPSPSIKQRRGRNQGLTFRRHPKEFLRARSPQGKSRGKGLQASTSGSIAGTLAPSASSSLAGLSMSPSGAPSTLAPMSPSLRTKESNLSVATTPSMSSDQSADASPGANEDTTATLRSPVHDEAHAKNKKLKKYKEGAEKVFSLFGSQRPSSSA